MQDNERAPMYTASTRSVYNRPAVALSIRKANTARTKTRDSLNHLIRIQRATRVSRFDPEEATYECIIRIVREPSDRRINRDPIERFLPRLLTVHCAPVLYSSFFDRIERRTPRIRANCSPRFLSSLLFVSFIS